MSSGVFSYGVSATAYGRNPADAYYTLSSGGGGGGGGGNLVVNGNLDVTGDADIVGSLGAGELNVGSIPNLINANGANGKLTSRRLDGAWTSPFLSPPAGAPFMLLGNTLLYWGVFSALAVPANTVVNQLITYNQTGWPTNAPRTPQNVLITLRGGLQTSSPADPVCTAAVAANPVMDQEGFVVRVFNPSATIAATVDIFYAIVMPIENVG